MPLGPMAETAMPLGAGTDGKEAAMAGSADPPAGRGALRVGIVGLASLYWPRALAENLARLPRARLLAAAHLGEGDEQIAATLGMSSGQFAETFGVKLYEGIEEMIEAEGLDAVAVCTRHTLHAEHVERSAGAGADVYLCKTMATTRADCDRIVEAGRRHGVRIAVGPGGRFQPHHAAARQAVEAGRVGRAVAVRIAHNHGTIDVFGPTDWYRDPAEGGPELSLGWYVIDVLRSIVPRPVRRVFAEYGNFSSPGSPFMDQGKIVLRFDDETIGACDMYFSNRFGFPTWNLEVIGTEGAIRTHAGRAGDGVPRAVLWTSAGPEPLEVAEGDNWTADTAAWVAAFADDGPPPLDAEEARAITEICLACRQSARTGQAVTL